MRTRNFLAAALTIVVLLLLTSSITYAADNIYVSCYGSGTVEKINWEGNKTTFASGFNGPTGLAFDGNGNLYVANGNSGNTTIEKIDSSGNRSVFASRLYWPKGMVYDNAGHLYVTNSPTDGGRGSIWYYNTIDGTSGTFANNSINTPRGLAIGRGTMWATMGTWVWYWGSMSKMTYATINNPQGIAFDRNDNLFVASSDDGTIIKYDTLGNSSIFASGLNAPCGLAFDSTGNLYVANQGSGTIEKFDSTGLGSVIATGLNQPSWIATQVPEPCTLLLLGLGAAMAVRKQTRSEATGPLRK